eukprot:scaffold114449_cov72-Phaeocystis_antarctica.AAC.2
MPPQPPRPRLGRPGAQCTELKTEHRAPHGPLDPAPLDGACPQLTPAAHEPPRTQAGHGPQRGEVCGDVCCEGWPGTSPCCRPCSPCVHGGAAGM